MLQFLKQFWGFPGILVNVQGKIGAPYRNMTQIGWQVCDYIALPSGEDFYQGGHCPPMPPPWRRPWMDPRINVIDENWQRSKCDMLAISFESVCRQPSSIVGQSLSGFEPFETEHIEGDGNCLFRCLSKLVTGSENSHLQIRSIISRFIASEGTKKLGWYFKIKQMTPCEYPPCIDLSTVNPFGEQMPKFMQLLLFLMPMSTLPIIFTNLRVTNCRGTLEFIQSHR